MRVADITKGMTSQNDRFILHDGEGFEYGKVGNLDVITCFIKERRNHQDIKEQLHAVWCVQIQRIDASNLTSNLIGCVSKYPTVMRGNA